MPKRSSLSARNALVNKSNMPVGAIPAEIAAIRSACRDTKQTKNNETNEKSNYFVCFVIFRLFRVSLLISRIVRMTRPRIISLIASATEIVCALGFEQDLVGRSHECDFPASVTRLPVCTSPKFQVEGLSYQIDQRVKAILQEALSVYRVDAEVLESLRPTHIITQSQCEVCAVSLKDVEQAVCQFTSSQPRIVSLEPNKLDDVFADIRTVANALEAPGRADNLISEMERRISEIKARTALAGMRPGIACIEWIDPLMAAGNWMPELVELAGGVNLFGQPGKHSPLMKWEELIAADPDVIFI